MAKLKFCNFGSNNFAVLTTPELGGSFYILKKINQVTTVLYSGDMAIELYAGLKRDYRKSRAEYDRQCGFYKFMELV